MSVLVARLGQADTAMLRAGAGKGGLTIQKHALVRIPSLDADDLPNSSASRVVRALAEEVGGGDAVTLALPSSVTRAVRLAVEDASPGRVTFERLDGLLAAARRRAGKGGRAVLACRIVSTLLDGEPVGDPAGRDAAVLAVRVAAVTAEIGTLKAFEDAITDAGLALAGVVSAPEAIGVALVPDGEGAAVRVGWARSLAVAVAGASVAGAADVPLGRRHLLADLVQAFGLEERDAETRLERLLTGRADPEAERVVASRLAEIEELLSEAAGAAGVVTSGAVLSGLPARAFDDAAAPQASLPPPLADDPVLAGAALLVLGLRGHHDAAVTTGEARPSVLSWLRRRF